MSEIIKRSGTAWDNVMDNIIETANKNAKTNEGDYEKDGLLHCGKCNTPKQKDMRSRGFSIVTIPCKCEAEAKEKREQEERIKRLRDYCIDVPRWHNYRFENADNRNQQIIAEAKKYVDNFDTRDKEGRGLLFYGDVGRGKTYASLCIANALIDRGICCYVTDFPKLSRQWDDLSRGYGGKEEFLDRLNANHVLIIDDLGAERQTDFTQEMVYAIIDKRTRVGKPLIITTNFTKEQLALPDNETHRKTFNRLRELCVPVKCDGVDRRSESLIDFKQKTVEK